MTTPPIVLVHGAWHGAWCWTQVADDLRSRGHDVRTVTLPGHEMPARRERLWFGARAYLAAIDAEVRACPAPPVLVGHSMGGYLTQRYLETHDLPGALLLASVPRTGVTTTTWRLLRRTPGPIARSVATLSLWPAVSGPGAARDLFFTERTDAAIVDAVAAKLQNESFVAYQAMLLRWPRPKRVSTPVAVVAAEDDAVFPVHEEEALARAYGVPLQVLPGAGHDAMVDTDWIAVSEAIDRFVGSRP